MLRPGQVERCVFCDRLIGPDEPRVGRGESSAHAACADAALGDEQRWEQIAAGVGDESQPAGDEVGPGLEAESGREPGGSRAARAGCATGLIALVLALAVSRRDRG